MAGPRIYGRSTPYVHRIAEWSSNNFYSDGTIVRTLSSDSDSYLYVCLEDHRSNDSDNTLENRDKWVLWKFSGPVDSDAPFSFALAKTLVNNLLTTYSNDQVYFDGYVNYYSTIVPTLYDSDGIDSEITQAGIEIERINDKPITDYLDSDYEHLQIFVWDSDTETWKNQRRILSVNSVTQNSLRDIPLSINMTYYGPLDDRPDSEVKGSIFIVNGDSDSDNNGRSFAFIDSWTEILKDVRLNVNLYLRVNPNNYHLKGSLLVQNLIPSLDSEIVSKYYVDQIANSSIKQDRFITFDSENTVDTSLLVNGDFIINTNKAELLYFNGINTSYVNKTSYGDFSTIEDAITNGTIIQVFCNALSTSVEGTLSLQNNGVYQPFTLAANCAGTSVSGIATQFVLLSESLQSFDISITGGITLGNKYILRYTSHDGFTTELVKEAGVSDWTLTEIKEMDYGTY